jgi:hypothetical protein
MIFLITGVSILVFFSLAAMNGVKKYIKSPIINALAKQHRVFGMLATLAAFIHAGYALSLGMLRITGSLTLMSLILTGVFGALFYQKKLKWMYTMHRIMGPLTLVLAIVHIVLNNRY